MTDTDPVVLVIDDDESVVDLFTSYLDDEYEVRAAYSGTEGLERLDDEVDVALVDRRMPGMDGDEVLSVIRERRPDVRVAMTTGVRPDFDIIELGFDDYLVKPIDEEELRRSVEQLLMRATYDDELQEYLATVSKKAVLETEKDRDELEESEEYGALEDRVDEARERLDTLVDAMAHDRTGVLSSDPAPDGDGDESVDGPGDEPGDDTPSPEDASDGAEPTVATATAADDELVSFFEQEAGSTLRGVLRYDPGSWRLLYARRRGEVFGGTDDAVDAVVDQFREDDPANDARERTFLAGTLYCSLHLFEEAVVIHFRQRPGFGIVCSFDPDAAPHLTTFVQLCLPMLRQHARETVDDAGTGKQHPAE